MKWLQNNKSKCVQISVMVLCVILCLIMVVKIPVRAEIFTDINPELTAITLDSEAEVSNGDTYYTPVTKFSQGNGKYTLSSNSYTVWYGADDVSFAYKQYNVSQDTAAVDDYLNAEVTIDAPLTGTSVLHKNASMGLMFRSGLENDSSDVFLHIREGSSVVCVYRANNETSTKVQRTGVDITFPCTLRMELKGYIINLYYKSAGEKSFNKFSYPVSMRGTGPIYVGVATHSVSESNMATAQFSNLKVEGYGSWTPSSDNTGSVSSQEPTVSEYVEEDPPLSSDTIYRETFSENDMETVFGTGGEGIIENQEGNRVWYKNLVDSEELFGETSWTDYELSARVSFTENCNPDPESASNTFRLFARRKSVEFYGVTAYYAQITEGYKIALYKRCFTKEGVEYEGTRVSDIVNLRTLYNNKEYTCLGDGLWHTFKIRAFDNQITVFWDDQAVISWEDDGTTYMSGEGWAGDFVFGSGGIGIATLETSVYIDDIYVTKLDDTFGGDYDNKIGGKWNDPIPSYVSDWNYK